MVATGRVIIVQLSLLKEVMFLLSNWAQFVSGSVKN